MGTHSEKHQTQYSSYGGSDGYHPDPVACVRKVAAPGRCHDDADAGNGYWQGSLSRRQAILLNEVGGEIGVEGEEGQPVAEVGYAQVPDEAEPEQWNKSVEDSPGNDVRRLASRQQDEHQHPHSRRQRCCQVEAPAPSIRVSHDGHQRYAHHAGKAHARCHQAEGLAAPLHRYVVAHYGPEGGRHDAHQSGDSSKDQG